MPHALRFGAAAYSLPILRGARVDSSSRRGVRASTR